LFGLILFIFGIYGDLKLKILKTKGKSYVPLKTVLVPKTLFGSQFSTRSSQYFYIECTVNKNGKEIKRKSRDLIVCLGLFAVTKSLHIGYEAVVYVDPKRPWVYAVDVKLE
jgi:hypothetical protein